MPNKGPPSFISLDLPKQVQLLLQLLQPLQRERGTAWAVARICIKTDIQKVHVDVARTKY